MNCHSTDQPRPRRIGLAMGRIRAVTPDLQYGATRAASLLKVLVLTVMLIGCNGTVGKTGLRTVVVKVDGKPIRVEIAADRTTRTRGLMFRARLRKDEGMLFVYPTERRMAFWMKNTIIPLDIGFFDGQGVLIRYTTMIVQKDTPDHKMRTYFSGGAAKYALEMNQGWFKRNKIRKRARLSLPRPIAATE